MSANIDLKTLEAERAAFERAIAIDAQAAGSEVTFSQHDDGTYRAPAIQSAWHGWWSRAALAAAPAATQEVQDAQPVAIVRHFEYAGVARNGHRQEAQMLDGAPALKDGTRLYAAPQPAALPHPSLVDRIAGTISRHINEPLVQGHVLAAAREIAGYATHPHPSGDSGQLAGGQDHARAALPPLNDELISILGRPNFTCITFANVLRAGGQEIRRKAEHEQAAVIHFLLRHYLASPADWRQHADDALREMHAACARAQQDGGDAA